MATAGDGTAVPAGRAALVAALNAAARQSLGPANAQPVSGLHQCGLTASCHVDGLLLGRAVHHTAHLACGVAAEDALLLLCPLKWEAVLGNPELWPHVAMRGGRLVPLPRASPPLQSLSVWDDSIVDANEFVWTTRTPAQVLADLAALRFGTTQPSAHHEVVERLLPAIDEHAPSRVHRLTTRLGSLEAEDVLMLGKYVGVGEGVCRRRAAQLSKLEVVREALREHYPQLQLWSDVVAFFSDDAKRAPRRSGLAQQLLEADKRSIRTDKRAERERGRSQGAEGGGADGWQNQFRVESARRKRVARDGEARRRLRAAMARLEALASASAISEAMRRDEPSHLSAALGEAAAESGGVRQSELEEPQQQQAAVEAVDASSAAPAAKRARRAWAPWKAGTKGHAALAEGGGRVWRKRKWGKYTTKRSG
ncbi:hypothetical protein EMIHUDRAFT_230102 [Emiliania huxleyi CCMP1516]|uniref:Uncharacterized protein n=2 Tax=Emiliania huxleyi TaxID=2903 RepID=A0A0D3KB16_EMIH1|nr:hypothetical protein EMIHUDRAFT_230102 [Emiliania huxleyi CCMP1516]EOD32951.1 hypothetical protein EMIHUDRAFT_230102 [Emiliania huxleyi CCMP1516]|eukprot:XP_005785380.1 hypothetical protein EMIHUDRAFT_230102 [Emiliania huxleyi CCMP1516]